MTAIRMAARSLRFSTQVSRSFHASAKRCGEATDASFAKDLKNAKSTPVLVDFYATWCGPCKMIAPILTKVTSESNVKLLKVNVDEAQKVSAEYDISALPTVVGFRDGKEVGRFMGMKDEKFIKNFVDKIKA